MAIKRTVTCDITGREMNDQELNKATVIGIQYKDVGMVPGYGSNPSCEAIREMLNYEFHICAEHAPRFMEEFKKIIKRMKKEA